MGRFGEEEEEEVTGSSFGQSVRGQSRCVVDFPTGIMTSADLSSQAVVGNASLVMRGRTESKRQRYGSNMQQP